MELVRLYYNSMDVKPKVLIRHFLRYLGLYVEEVTDDSKQSAVSSVADIYYICSAGEYESYAADCWDFSKAVFIFRDGALPVQESEISIVYKENEKDVDFLKEFLMKLSVVFRQQNTETGRLVRYTAKLEEILKSIAVLYVNNNIMQSVLYTKCFYKQEELYRRALKHYTAFLGQLNQLQVEDDNEDMMKYIISYSKFEVNLICKNNSYEFLYPVEDLLEVCQELAKKYSSNEQIHILTADIKLELEERWLEASDEYASAQLAHCAYAYYKWGRIVRKYLKDYESALPILKKAVEIKPDYFAAWYQIGMCLEKKSDYFGALKAFQKIGGILERKYKNHLLAPVELEYLFKSLMKMAQIYKTELDNYVTAYAYSDLAESVKVEAGNTTYLSHVWGEALKDPDILKIIQDKIEQKLDVQLCQMY